VCVFVYLDPQFKLSLFYVQWIPVLHDKCTGGGFLVCLSRCCKVYNPKVKLRWYITLLVCSKSGNYAMTVTEVHLWLHASSFR
jgi:hypothetical protein